MTDKCNDSWEVEVISGCTDCGELHNKWGRSGGQLPLLYQRRSEVFKTRGFL
jgi:hypothetical protein